MLHRAKFQTHAVAAQFALACTATGVTAWTEPSGTGFTVYWQ